MLVRVTTFLLCAELPALSAHPLICPPEPRLAGSILSLAFWPFESLHSWRMTSRSPSWEEASGGACPFPPLEVAEAKQSTGILSLPGQLHGRGFPPRLALTPPSGYELGWREYPCLCHHPEAQEGRCLLTTSFQAATAAGWQLGQSKNKAYFGSLYIDLQGDLHLPF